MSSEHNEALQAFLLGDHRNQWIEHADMKVYVRKAQRTLPPMRAFMDVLDVANVTVYKEQQGTFTRWLAMAEELAREHGYDAIYVESVLNPHLASFLTKQGYTRMGLPECPSYFRFT